MMSDKRKKLLFKSLILRVGWVWTLEKCITKFYVTNWEGRVGLNPNLYDVTLFNLFVDSVGDFQMVIVKHRYRMRLHSTYLNHKFLILFPWNQQPTDNISSKLGIMSNKVQSFPNSKYLVCMNS